MTFVPAVQNALVSWTNLCNSTPLEEEDGTGKGYITINRSFGSYLSIESLLNYFWVESRLQGGDAKVGEAGFISFVHPLYRRFSG